MRFPPLPISPDSAANLVFLAILVFSFLGSLTTGALLWMAAAERRSFASIEPRWRELSGKLSRFLLAVAVVVTGFAGSLAWFSVTVVYPGAAADVLQIFSLPLTAGWLGLALCLVFLGAHTSSWGRWRSAPKRHWALGAAAAASLWIAAAVFISLRSFLLTGRSWNENRSLWVAVLNPSAIPDLFHWGFLALAVSGAAGIFYAACQRDELWKRGLAHALGAWVTKAAFAAAVLGLMWAGVVFLFTGAGVSFGLWAAIVFLLEAGLAWVVRVFVVRRLDRFGLRAAALSVVLAGLALAASEASRQAVPSPFLIQGHMYRNGIRVSEVSLLNETGYWKPVPWEAGHEAPAGELLGAYLFRGQCAVCHAGEDWRSAKTRLRYEDDVSKFLSDMNRRHPALPVVAGTEAEKEALKIYLRNILGAAGHRPVPRPPPPAPKAPPAPPKPEPRPRKVSPPEEKAPAPKEESAPPPEEAAPEKKAPSAEEKKPAAGETAPPESGPGDGVGLKPAPAEAPKAAEEAPPRAPKEETPPPAAPAEEKKQGDGGGASPEKPQAKKEEKAPVAPESSGDQAPKPPAEEEKRKESPAASPPAETPPPSPQAKPAPVSPSTAAPPRPEKKLEEDNFPVPEKNIVIIDPEKEKKEEKKPGNPGAPADAGKKAAPPGEKP